MAIEPATIVFDRRLLTEPLFEFIVVSDTHYMLDSLGKSVEFPSRLKQSSRAEIAYRHIAALEIDLIIHLGDLVQEYPETGDFHRAMLQARQQIRHCGLQLKQVAGNHDVGDKLDGTMPTSPVTRESLDWYHAEFGPSWYSILREGCLLVVLNSQIMNTDLPEAARQRQWMEQELIEHCGKRVFVFLHLPPYLWDENEPSLGHYENIDQPDRGWLLGLAEQYSIEMILAGHVHASFYDHYKTTRYFVANSTSFTRPGFCHMYTSGPLPERGRDDTEKLGFYLLRVFADRVDVHFIRTRGMTELPAASSRKVAHLLTRTPAGFDRPRIGITLRQAITPVAEVPLAWPASIRERIRNDYPMLACNELGIGSVRTQWTDLQDPFQSRRLAILRREKVALTATSIWSSGLNLSQQLEKYSSEVDRWEIQLPGSPWPTGDCLRDIKNCTQSFSVPIDLSTVVPGEIVAGKQHPRTRLGYKLDELAELNRILAEADISIARVNCMIAVGESPWLAVKQLLRLGSLSQIAAVDFSVSLTSLDDAENGARAAEAMFALAMTSESRIYFDPLLDLDRSMDTCNGLLDTICNPRDVFHVVRCLNSILFTGGEEVYRPDETAEGKVVRQTIENSRASHVLLLPAWQAEAGQNAESLLPRVASVAEVRLYRLAQGTVENLSLAEARQTVAGMAANQPLLISHHL